MQKQTIKIDDNVFALFSAKSDEKLVGFLGTAWAEATHGVCITCAHVLPDEFDQLVIVRGIGGRQAVSLIAKDNERDLALLRPSTALPRSPWRVSVGDPSWATGDLLSCFEFSATQQLPDKRFKVLTRTHVGNAVSVHRLLEGNVLPRLASQDAIELSFPALKGASGAPVVDRFTCEVAGVVAANNEAELAPSSVYEYTDGETYIERVRYIPSGIAIHGRHVAAFMSDAGFALG